MIQEERVRFLNHKVPKKGRYVLYWMQASQRADYNHALEYAVIQANALRQPLLVFFGLTENFPEANERHYAFMLQGLREVKRSLAKRSIPMVLRRISPDQGALQFSENASLAVVDRGYLRIQKQWRNFAAGRMDCPLIQVESDVVVPVEQASPKEEYSAATLRAKMNKKLDRFLHPLKKRKLKVDSLSLNFESFEIDDVGKAIAQLSIDRSVKQVAVFRGGTKEAQKHFRAFIKNELDRYPERRNDPGLDSLSHMSPYLHFGQISPLYLALWVLESESPGNEAFLEELIVRRELSMNFVCYNDQYDSLAGLPQWAQTTLSAHRQNRRPYLYNLEELEKAATHDPYWNAAQKEMVWRGKMHGYMRMYWGKKILEWSRTPEEAMRTALYLNNKYELDGRDPNAFTGVSWCFGKHDRPWAERPIFGLVRYMNDRGLRRKFDADGYVQKVAKLDPGLNFCNTSVF